MASEKSTEASAPLRFPFASSLVLSSMFALTGVGCALLGAALPALLAHWLLTDRGAGFIFLLAWLGAAGGALLSRGDRARSVARGLALASLCCFALAAAKGAAVFPLTLGYGLGLGITMTSISLLRSERAGSRRPQELNRLNLLWALGALACPAFAARALLTSSPAYLFTALGCFFALGALWAALFEPKQPPLRVEKAMRLPSVPLVFCLFSSLTVGTEASLSAWLTTYCKRSDHSVAGAVTAATAFWAGLLLSRALYSAPWLRRVGARAAFRSHSWLVAGALLLLSFAFQPLALAALAFVLGFGLGPLYPLLLALVLPQYRGNLVFLFAGLGSAVLPWFTGVLSSQAGSLRAGLAVPCAGSFALALLAWRTPAARTEAHGILRGGL